MQSKNEINRRQLTALDPNESFNFSISVDLALHSDFGGYLDADDIFPASRSSTVSNA